MLEPSRSSATITIYGCSELYKANHCVKISLRSLEDGVRTLHKGETTARRRGGDIGVAARLAPVSGRRRAAARQQRSRAVGRRGEADAQRRRRREHAERRQLR